MPATQSRDPADPALSTQAPSAISGSRLQNAGIADRLLQLEGQAWLAERIEGWLKAS